MTLRGPDAVTQAYMRRVTALILPLLLSSCGDTTGLGLSCPDILQIWISPRDTTVSVGAVVHARVGLFTGCDEPIPDTFTWTSSHPNVVSTSRVFGTTSVVKLTARAAGSALVSVSGAKHRNLGGVAVTVAGAP